MPRRSYRRKSKDDPLAALGGLLGLLAIGAFYKLSNTGRLVTLACALILLAGVLFWLLQRREHERKKLRALRMVDIDSMDGLDFEKYVAEVIKPQGFTQISLTERYDYGVDIIAHKDGVRWGIQVKRHKNIVKAEAVRQVVTGLNKYNCSRSMVVTNSTFSRPARILAESNNCVLIDKDILADWIVAYQAHKP